MKTMDSNCEVDDSESSSSLQRYMRLGLPSGKVEPEIIVVMQSEGPSFHYSDTSWMQMQHKLANTNENYFVLSDYQ